MSESNLVVTNDNKFCNIFKQTVDDMKILGTYKPEFSPVITRYAEMRVQYEMLMENWYSEGCVITERYTNKAGATNNRKTTLYQAIETLRSDITVLERELGLTPSGLKKINDKSMAVKKESVLAKALSKLE